MRFFHPIKTLVAIACVIPIGLGMITHALADWRNDVGIFRIGVVAEGQASNYMVKLEPFRLALIEAMQIEVEFYTAPDTSALITALRTDRIEYAILPSSAFALAWVVCECVEPLVVPRAADGTDGYNIILLSGPAGPRSLDDLASGRIGVLSSDSLLGSVYPIKQMQAEGTVPETEIKIVAYQSSRDAIDDFLGRRLDTLIGWSSLTGEPSNGYSRGTLTEIAARSNYVPADYTILWQSAHIPHRPHVVRRKLSGEAKRILKDTLLNLFSDDPVAYDSIEPVYGGGFAATRQDKFTPLINFMKSLDTNPDEQGTKPENPEDASEGALQN